MGPLSKMQIRHLQLFIWQLLNNSFFVGISKWLISWFNNFQCFFQKLHIHMIDIFHPLTMIAVLNFANLTGKASARLYLKCSGGLDEHKCDYNDAIMI